MWKFILLLVVMIGVHASSDHQYNVIRRKRIVGGLPGTNKESYTVAIKLGRKIYCSGVLIAPLWVLTSGDCVYLMETKILSVVVRSQTRNDILGVQKIIKHPDFDYWYLYNNLALIKVETAVANPVLVTLPQGQQSPDRKDCVMSGWGHTDENESETDDVMKMDVSIISDDDCADYYAIFGDFPRDNFTCADWNGDGKGTCQGDAGGPLVCSSQLEGILSWSEGCAQANGIAVYTEVATYVKWIEETMKTQ